MASGDTLLELSPLAAELPATLYGLLGLRNQHPTIQFDPATAWNVNWTGVLPRHYAGGGITVSIWWTSPAVTGNVIWLVSIERMDAATDLDADSFAATQTVTTAVQATSGAPSISAIPLTNAQIDGLLAGEAFRIKIQRDAANASDTCANNAELLIVEIKET